MSLRPYQIEFVDGILAALVEHDRVLGEMATGGGKTCCAGILAKRALPGGPVLFLADAKELVTQAAEKLGIWADRVPAVEMANEHARPGQDELIVATTQSIARRLDKYPRTYFSLIIVDEAHRNTLGAQAQEVLAHFETAQVVGITATPFRSDKKQLGAYYQTIAEPRVGLVRLIQEKWLSRIVIKSIPVGISLREVRTVAGDYREDDLGRAIEPHLLRCAKLLAEHAQSRRSVVFLPLIESSRAFVAACRSIGLRAVHVDGTEREALKAFRAREADIICNAQLLSTGWDEPSVDCVMILRPTKSLVLYSQMVGRGTRICERKENLLLLDPLFLSDELDLIRPARLVAHTSEDAEALQSVLDGAGDLFETDMLEAQITAAELRRRALEKRLGEVAKRKARTIDAIEFALSLGDNDLAEYEPETKWEGAPVSPGQAGVLEKNGFDLGSIKGKGHASKIIDLIFKRREMGLASPKQLRWLLRFRTPEAHLVTFEAASRILDQRFGGGRKAV